MLIFIIVAVAIFSAITIAIIGLFFVQSMNRKVSSIPGDEPEDYCSLSTTGCFPIPDNLTKKHGTIKQDVCTHSKRYTGNCGPLPEREYTTSSRSKE